jgi:hypothetical protein
LRFISINLCALHEADAVHNKHSGLIAQSFRLTAIPAYRIARRVSPIDQQPFSLKGDFHEID